RTRARGGGMGGLVLGAPRGTQAGGGGGKPPARRALRFNQAEPPRGGTPPPAGAAPPRGGAASGRFYANPVISGWDWTAIRWQPACTARRCTTYVRPGRAGWPPDPDWRGRAYRLKRYGRRPRRPRE